MDVSDYRLLDHNGAEIQFDPQVTVSLRLSSTAREYHRSIKPSGARVVPVNDAGQPTASFDESNSSDDTQSSVADLKYDFDQLPQPYFPGRILGNITPQTTRMRIVSIATTLYPQLYPWLGRAPTQEEAELVAWHMARGIQQGSAGPFLGATLALTRAALTLRRGAWHLPLPFRTPFNYKRGASFDPNVLRFMGREVLKGQPATTVHRLFRSTLYGFSGYALGTLYYSYKVQASIISAAQDPKLAEIRDATKQASEAMRENIKARMQGARGSRETARSSQTTNSGQAGNAQSEPSGRWGRRAGGSADDASPTGGQAMSDDYFAQPETVNEDRFAQSSSQSDGGPGDERFAETRAQAGGRERTWPMTRSRPQPSSMDEASGNNSDDFFSNSSSSSEAPPRAQSQVSQPVGSAWERLRRGGSAAAVPRRPGSPAAQSDTSHSEDDRSQAQRDFDAMLERERESDESNRSSRW